jgi:hypothetical protein
VIAPYNDRFGRRFAELFAAAAAQVKAYAEDIQQRGGSLSSRVHGDITIQHLTQIEEQTILATEYRRAQEQFHHVSKLKKAVDSRTLSARTHASHSPPVAPVTQASPVAPATPAPPAQPQARVPATALNAHGFGNPAHSQEDNRIRSVEESIRSWVRAADARCRQAVPMKFGNFVLTPAESDAYCADFCEEKSFRGENARAMVRMVAVMARIQAETEEFRLRQNSTHLWRPHADALQLLEEASSQVIQSAFAVLQVANQRGLAEKAKILSATMDRLRNRVTLAQEALAVVGNKTVLS